MGHELRLFALALGGLMVIYCPVRTLNKRKCAASVKHLHFSVFSDLRVLLELMDFQVDQDLRVRR